MKVMDSGIVLLAKADFGIISRLSFFPAWCVQPVMVSYGRLQDKKRFELLQRKPTEKLVSSLQSFHAANKYC